MKRIQIFVEPEKRTPELLAKIDDFVWDYCDLIDKDESRGWYIDCLTERDDLLVDDLVSLTEDIRNVLISFRSRDINFGDIRQYWFLNGTEDERKAVVVYPMADPEFLGSYQGLTE